MKRLSENFFARSAHDLAMILLGCELRVNGCAVRIVETEAYTPDDEASHSFRGSGGRAHTMYRPVGTIYVYRSYGIHHCINIVCDRDRPGSAVLIRAGEPVTGSSRMANRRGIPPDRRELSNGPGKLAQALGVTTDDWNGRMLNDASEGDAGMWVTPGQPPARILQTARVGISKAVDLPRRYLNPDSQYLLRKYRV